jgi:large subunit ribosomal protein L22
MAENEEKKVTAATADVAAKTVAEPAAKATDAKAVKKAVKKADKKADKKDDKKPLRTEAEARLLNYGVTPRKVRLVINTIRGKDLSDVYDILEHTERGCAQDIEKLVKSCEANAINNFKMNGDTLYVSDITAGDGAKLKRVMPRAKGSASGIVKRWSNIYVTLKNREAK